MCFADLRSARARVAVVKLRPLHRQRNQTSHRTTTTTTLLSPVQRRQHLPGGWSRRPPTPKRQPPQPGSIQRRWLVEGWGGAFWVDDAACIIIILGCRVCVVVERKSVFFLCSIEVDSRRDSGSAESHVVLRVPRDRVVGMVRALCCPQVDRCAYSTIRTSTLVLWQRKKARFAEMSSMLSRLMCV